MIYEDKKIQEDKRLTRLLQMYDTYFTASNVKVYLQNRFTGKMVQVDTATGIGYSYNVSSVPIHVLGARTPAYFSRGNGVGQGTLVTVFKDPLYMKAMLKFIFDEDMPLPSGLQVKEVGEEKKELSPPFQATQILGIHIAEGVMTEKEYARYSALIQKANASAEAIAEGLRALRIRMYNQKNTRISDDEFNLKHKKTVASLSDESYLKPADVLDIGSIHTLFDIRIVFNNSTPYFNNNDVSLVLRDCKLVSDQMDTSSLQDGILQQSFNFIFKTISA